MPDKTEMVVQLVQKRILQTEKPVYLWHSSQGQSAVSGHCPDQQVDGLFDPM